jgi:hypothetical protein
VTFGLSDVGVRGNDVSVAMSFVLTTVGISGTAGLAQDTSAINTSRFKILFIEPHVGVREHAGKK